jgi:hypothetical protein
VPAGVHVVHVRPPRGRARGRRGATRGAAGRW